MADPEIKKRFGRGTQYNLKVWKSSKKTNLRALHLICSRGATRRRS